MTLNEYAQYFCKNHTFGNWQVLVSSVYKIKNKPKILCRCTYCNNTIKLVRCDQLIKGLSIKCENCRKNSLKKNKQEIYKGILSLVFNKIKSSAKSRKIDFDITIQQVGDLFEKQQKKCALTGIELILKKNLTDNKATASLDRKDSKKGYTIENLHWVHKDVNKMKMDFKLDYFYYICELINKNKNGFN